MSPPAATPRGTPRTPRDPAPAGSAAPSGEDPAHPANPARPFRGAGSRAGSGGLAAAPTPRPVGADPAARGTTTPGEGWSAVRRRGRRTAQDRTTLASPSVTLSNENAPSRSRTAPHPRPAANAALEAAHGRPAARSGLAVPLPFDREVS